MKSFGIFASILALTMTSSASPVPLPEEPNNTTTILNKRSSAGYDIFSDNDCSNYLYSITVYSSFTSCTVTNPGFGSMKLNTDHDVGTITVYTKADCGCPTCGSHGYDAKDAGCLNNFGFTGNAVSLI